MTMSIKTNRKLQRLLASKAVKSGHAMIRAVGGLTRYRIIVILNDHPSGLTVTHLANVLGASPSQISHQIHILKKFDLIHGDPDGRMIVYRLNEQKAKPFLF